MCMAHTGRGGSGVAPFTRTQDGLGWDEVSQRQSLRHPLTGPRLGAGDDALPKGMVSPPARTQISRYLLSQQVKSIPE